MNILFFVILIIFLSCSNDSSNQKIEHKLFIHTGEYQNVEIPISEDYNFVESTVWLMGTPDYISYTDTLHDQRIKISPTTKATFLNNEKHWLKSEEELIEGVDKMHDLMKNQKAFHLPVSQYIGQDSIISTSLTYYPYWKTDSRGSLKYVEFTKTIQNSLGWCDVSIRKPYTELNIPKDFMWADSLAKMKIIIKGEKVKKNVH